MKDLIETMSIFLKYKNPHYEVVRTEQVEGE